MQRISTTINNLKKASAWDILSLCLISMVVTIIIVRWENFPFFVDIYYHLSIMEMFDQAGGVVIWDFLQYAPAGRANLYPPFLHILMLGMYKIGFSIDLIGKIVSSIMFPLTMAATWWLMRKVFGAGAAFVSISFLLASWEFFYTTAVVSASAFATVLALLTYYAIYKKKYAAAAVLMTFCLYTHLSYPHLIAASLVLWAILDRPVRKGILKTLLASYLLFSPWLANIILNYGSLGMTSMAGRILDVNLWLLASMLLGVAFSTYALVKKGDKRYIIPLAMLSAMMPILFTYSSRFVTHAAVPMALLCGAGLSGAAGLVSKRFGGRGVHLGTAILLISSIIALTVAVSYDFDMGQDMINNKVPNMQERDIPGGVPSPDNNYLDPNYQEYGTLPEPKQNVQGPYQDGVRDPIKKDRLQTDQATLFILYYGDILRSPSHEGIKYQSLISEIEDLTDPDDIIVVPQGANGCIITSLTGRATTSGMFHEVTSEEGAIPKVQGQIPKAYELPGGTMVIDGALLDNEIPTAFPYHLSFLLILAGMAVMIYDFKVSREE